MEFEKIKQLMQALDNSSLMEFEIKLNDGFYLRMNKHENISVNSGVINEVPVKEQRDVKVENVTIFDKATENSASENQGNIMVSPIVGTFYSSSSPSKPAFVNVGDNVKEGDTICIIEAMKVMNEIKSQFTGKIVEIFVQNEDMVEYNQPLFRVI